LLLDHFEKEDQLFAALCIWWQANIIQFTEILIYYRHYKIFPSDDKNYLEVTPVSDKPVESLLISESDIPELNLSTKYKNSNRKVLEYLSREKSLPRSQERNQQKHKSIIHTTHCRGLFKKIQNFTSFELEAGFGKESVEHQSQIRSLV